MSTLDVTTTHATPFSRLVKVELRKAYDTRAGFWLLIVIGCLVLLAEGGLLIASAVNEEDVSFGDFVGVAAFITSIMLPVLGILLVTSEWSQRTAMVTFSLEPRRGLVLLAKLVTGLLLTLLTAAVATALGAVCNLISFGLQGEGSWEFGWNFFFGFLAVQSLTMAGGFALATLFLNTPTALVVFFVYKWALPGVLFALAASFAWFEDVGPWVNFQDALEPLSDMSLSSAAEWGRLFVSGAFWLVLPLGVGLWRVLRAEVK